MDIQSGHRDLDALLTLAAIAHKAQENAVRSIWDSIRESRCLVLQRGFDATPMLVRFGGLQDMLEKSARYLVKGVDVLGRPCWKAVPYADYRQLHPGQPTSSGVIEVLRNQTIHVT